MARIGVKAIISVSFIQLRPPGYFTHIPITTLIVSALKNYYIELSRISNGYFKPLLDPGGGFRIETAYEFITVICYGHSPTDTSTRSVVTVM